MLIPQTSRDNIMDFVTKYFIESVAPDAVLTNQNVRVHYYDTTSSETNNPAVRTKYLNFDIYVKNSELYGAEEDALLERDRLIFERIRELLTINGLVCDTRFTCFDDYRQVSKQEGYSRYHGVFKYKKIY